MRRCGREAEGDGLLNRYRGNPIVGSNPTVSANLSYFIIYNQILKLKIGFTVLQSVLQ